MANGALCSWNNEQCRVICHLFIYYAFADFRDVCLKSSSTESERCLKLTITTGARSVDNAEKA